MLFLKVNSAYSFNLLYEHNTKSLTDSPLS